MKHGISIIPGQIFSASGDYANCIRIGYGKPYDDTIDYGLKLLGALVRKMRGRQGVVSGE
jgi:DNA-binding transcriptional MocR family regulator